ncbi:MAG: hypothetical protein IJI43_00215 [Bacilli bacterium]|nr:hypothetical protein [Bacilli bacterium]
MDIPVYNIDDKQYLLIEQKEYNNNKYLFLLNKEDDDDYLIRKVDPDNKDFLIPLDNEDEVYEVLKNLVEN